MHLLKRFDGQSTQASRQSRRFRRLSTLSIIAIAAASFSTLWLPVGAPMAQQLSLRQERASALKMIAERGYCVGYFDANGDAAEILELKVTATSQEARQFIIELQRTKASMNRQAMVALALQGAVNGFGTEFGDDAAKALDDGIRRGTSDARGSSVDAVRRQYHSCKTEAVGNTAAQQAIQPTTRAPTSVEVKLREEAFSAGRAARIVVERAKMFSGHATTISKEGLQVAKEAGSPSIEGTRRIAYGDGTIYVGQTKGNLRHGLGISDMPNGQRHMGEWIGDRLGGLGAAQLPDDIIYSGQFLDGQATGLGVIERRNTARRSGEFREGLAEGLGLRQTLAPPFETRTGEFKRGELDGLGSEALDGRVIYVGQYRNGQRHGYGLIIGPSGEEEPSQWDQGKRIHPSTAAPALASKGQQQDATATSKEVVRPAPNAPNLAAVVTASEIEGVRQKIRPCWTQGGARDQAMIITLVVEMRQNGTPVKAELRDPGRYDSDPVYRAAADAVHRAIMNPRCQPWPLSPEKFNNWKTFTFNFDARDY